jgi:hypothetical protein
MYLPDINTLTKVDSMTAIVDGLYKQGKIELLQTPLGLPEGRIRLILIAQDQPQPPACYLPYGKYPGDKSTLEDFKGAQWHGEAEFDNQHGQ